MTSALDGREHCVMLDDAAEAIKNGTGRYPAVCDTWLTPTAMTAPPGRPCTRRVEHRRAAPTPGGSLARRLARRLRGPIRLTRRVRSRL